MVRGVLAWMLPLALFRCSGGPGYDLDVLIEGDNHAESVAPSTKGGLQRSTRGRADANASWRNLNNSVPEDEPTEPMLSSASNVEPLAATRWVTADSLNRLNAGDVFGAIKRSAMTHMPCHPTLQAAWILAVEEKIKWFTAQELLDVPFVFADLGWPFTSGLRDKWLLAVEEDMKHLTINQLAKVVSIVSKPGWSVDSSFQLKWIEAARNKLDGLTLPDVLGAMARALGEVEWHVDLDFQYSWGKAVQANLDEFTPYDLVDILSPLARHLWRVPTDFPNAWIAAAQDHIRRRTFESHELAKIVQGLGHLGWPTEPDFHQAWNEFGSEVLPILYA